MSDKSMDCKPLEVQKQRTDLLDRLFKHYAPRFVVPNKKVALEPFPVQEKKAEIKGKVLVPMNQAALTPLKVVFESGGYPEGAVAYVRSNLPGTTTYGKTVYEVETRKFILVPEDEVLLVDTQPTVQPQVVGTDGTPANVQEQ